MSEELNELLNDLKDWINCPLDEIERYGIWELEINQSKELLDYINLLQQEKQQLKEQLLEETKNNYKLKDKLEEKRKEYQETYKDVREEIKNYKTQLKQRDEVIEEAIEYLLTATLVDTSNFHQRNTLLNILNKYKGDSNE